MNKFSCKCPRNTCLFPPGKRSLFCPKGQLRVDETLIGHARLHTRPAGSQTQGGEVVQGLAEMKRSAIWKNSSCPSCAASLGSLWAGPLFCPEDSTPRAPSSLVFTLPWFRIKLLGTRVRFLSLFSVLLNEYLGADLLDHMVVLGLTSAQ